MKLIDRLLRRRAFSPAETEPDFLNGVRPAGDGERDRYPYDRAEALAQALEAWRQSPLARRVVGLVSQYVVGGGVTVTCRHLPTAQFVDHFWHHRLNHLPVRLTEWCDELTRTGNLFILLSTDAAGMSYVRAIPAADIERIQSLPNDVEQEVCYWPRPTPNCPDPQAWMAYSEADDAVEPADGTAVGAMDAGEGAAQAAPAGRDAGEAGISPFKPVMVHYAINRPVGAQWGESDLAPCLRWFSRYSSWLEDRARLNRYRNAFLYVVKSRFTNEAERKARQTALAAHPPSPGSILVVDESESWEVLNPRLESADAAADGLAIKKMIAAGSGVPLHFLAEPESSTRTTAEAAGGPTYRHFEQRQRFFLWLVEDLLHVVVKRRALVDHRVSRAADIDVQGADISARDNVALSMGANNVAHVMLLLRQHGLVDDLEALRMIYRFAGETAEIDELLARGRQAGPQEAGVEKSALPPASSGTVDPETGE